VHFINRGDTDLQRQIERMFQMDFNETHATSATEMSVEDRKALSIMENSAKLVDGHYQIALPWRNGTPSLPNNKQMAEKRLISLQWRLKRNPVLRKQYRTVIEDYLEKGYASKVADETTNQQPSTDQITTAERRWYLPHHPVINPQNPAKVRVVFYCAAKYRNTSLNG
jgi:hypothetical protein